MDKQKLNAADKAFTNNKYAFEQQYCDLCIWCPEKWMDIGI